MGLDQPPTLRDRQPTAAGQHQGRRREQILETPPIEKVNARASETDNDGFLPHSIIIESLPRRSRTMRHLDGPGLLVQRPQGRRQELHHEKLHQRVRIPLLHLRRHASRVRTLGPAPETGSLPLAFDNRPRNLHHHPVAGHVRPSRRQPPRALDRALGPGRLGGEVEHRGARGGLVVLLSGVLAARGQRVGGARGVGSRGRFEDLVEEVGEG